MTSRGNPAALFIAAAAVHSASPIPPGPAAAAPKASPCRGGHLAPSRRAANRREMRRVIEFFRTGPVDARRVVLGLHRAQEAVVSVLAQHLPEPHRTAENGMRPPCLRRPAPTQGSDSSAKQASTRSQAAARIRNSVAFTTGLAWVFSR
jgi:hypothetical protein